MNAQRSGCPINLTVEAFGDRWSLIVIRDLMFGNRRHFRELLTRSEEGIASNILADRLKRLEKAGSVSRRDDPSHKKKAHLQPDRSINRFGALAGPHGRLGPASHARVERTLRTREILEDGGPKRGRRFERRQRSRDRWTAGRASAPQGASK
jgi:hypothetical protein